MQTKKQAPPPVDEVQQRKEKQDTAKALLDLYKGSITNALPPGINAERMIRAVISATIRNPELLDCTPYSLMGAVLTVAGLGLLPDGVTGEAYLTASKRRGYMEAGFIIGYKGLCTLAYRSDKVTSIVAKAVYEGDEFKYRLGLNEFLDHVPKGAPDPAKITHFYSIVKTSINGQQGHTLDVMPIDYIIKARDESDNYISAPVKEDTIWHKNFADMGCKTVLRRNLKYTPFSTDIEKAIAHDEMGDAGKQNVKLEVLQDLATDQEMKDATYAEVINDEKEQKQVKKEAIKQAAKGKVAKGLEATEKAIENGLQSIKKKRPVTRRGK